MASGDDKDNVSPESVSIDKKDEDSREDFLSYLIKQAGISDKPKGEQLLDEVTFDGISNFISSGKVKHIVVMAGAGISTSAGIPDFRSPGSGLYDNLEKYNLPNPQAIFELGYFKAHPEPFFALAKQLWPGSFKPTPCHYFIKMLHDKGLLQRVYTQNIDTLERVSGLDGEVIIEAHGTFHTSHCLICRHVYTQQWMKEKILKDTVPLCDQEDCDGVVKPDIVFFGEALPERFFKCAEEDLKICDLLIVTGTSLVVQPFASLINRVSVTCPRLYINLEKSQGGGSSFMALLGYDDGFKFDAEDNYRDVFHQATCDEGCQALADKLGWGEELRSCVKSEHERIDAEILAAEQEQTAEQAQTAEQEQTAEQDSGANAEASDSAKAEESVSPKSEL